MQCITESKEKIKINCRIPQIELSSLIFEVLKAGIIDHKFEFFNTMDQDIISIDIEISKCYLKQLCELIHIYENM
jgi:hypothetical protein